MTFRHYTHWIFDMDGTLTEPVHDFDLIRAEIGIPQGVPILEAIARMTPDKAMAARRKLDQIETDLANRARPQPGIRLLLENLTGKGRKLAILTRNGERIGHLTLKAAGLDGFFDDEAVIGRETCAPKPDPAGVNHLLAMWNASRDTTLIVGDYLYDLKAGFDAGITTVHFDSTEAYSWPEYTHYRIARMDQLLTMA
ncbi:MAG: HAD family hydrolase [Gammaproteobacteria bacterium]|nr:HAD family hydrolase [Gammaproteobacteria bacterium]MYD75066.1 HAD family hydrolase [Gammaproteobacteria bacterium]